MTVGIGQGQAAAAYKLALQDAQGQVCHAPHLHCVRPPPLARTQMLVRPYSTLATRHA